MVEINFGVRGWVFMIDFFLSCVCMIGLLNKLWFFGYVLVFLKLC